MSVKKNFIYSSILTVSKYIFPLITYPYVSRVLGVNNIGICNYVESIIDYFVLFSMMGAAVVGIREIAQSKESKEKLSSAFFSLMIVNGATTIVSLIVLIVATYTLPELAPYQSMLGIGIIKLLGTFFLIDWFYKGVEDFKYITNRTLIIKCLYVIAIFLFVKTPDDYQIYFLIHVLTFGANAVLNILHAFKYLTLSNIHLYVKGMLKTYFIMGLYQILTSMYTSFNVAYLGFITSTTEVGYYTTATKIFTLILSLYTAFTGVMLPRMSSLLAEGKINEFNVLIKKSTNLLFLIGFPIMIYGLALSSDIVFVISGAGYEGAIIPFMLTMPLVFLIGYDQIQIIQILMPLRDNRAILTNSLLGATIGIVLNIVLVPYLSSIGSSLVLIASEIVIFISANIFVKKDIGYSFPLKTFIKELCIYIPLLLVLLLFVHYIDNMIMRLFMTLIITIFYSYIVNIIILHDELATHIFYQFRKLIFKKNVNNGNN